MKVLLMLLMFVAVDVHADPVKSLLSWASKQEVRTGAMYDLNQDIWGASYWVPMSYGSRNWQNSKHGWSYMDFLAGVAYKDGRDPKGLVGVLFRPVNISKWMFQKMPRNGVIARDRFLIKQMPDIAVGPTIALDNRVFSDYKKIRGREVFTVTAAFSFGGK